MYSDLSDHEIHTLGSIVNLEIRQEAAILLWYIWRNDRPRFSDLAACKSALEDDTLYGALKEACSKRDFGVIRFWQEWSPTVEPEIEYVITGDIETFLNNLRPMMKRIVNGEIALPFWSPSLESDFDPEIVEHLVSLKIPCVQGKPNLLLHDLGSFAHDPLLDRRLKNIFIPNNHTFLVNTSGSGKTRLLMEGLCENWGFYFTSLVDSSMLGSVDIRDSIELRVPKSEGFRRVLPPAGSPGYKKSLNVNREIASQIFRRVFLARLMIFHLFVEVMTEECSPMPHPEDHRIFRFRWLFLQLQPSFIDSQNWDIFDMLACKLTRSSDTFVDVTTKALLTETRRMLCPNPSHSSAAKQPQLRLPLFCVLDEAQHAATQHSTSFRSAQNGEHRPILREIVKAWEEQSYGQGVFMVVAGTGISKDVVDRAMGSAIMKDSRYRWCSDTGAFDHRDGQARYMEKYLPAKFLSSESGQRLLERVWYWLHGRHRFTSGYVAELLLDGFKRPHRLLNAYVEHFTQFKVTDATSFVESEVLCALPVLSQYKIDFYKFKKNTDMLTTIYELTTHYLMTSDLIDTLGKDEAMYVEYGFARFVDSETKSVAVDEPLVLLAARHWINTHHRSSYKFFTDRIRLNEQNQNSNGFENYLAFCIDIIFSHCRKLNEVFTFLGVPPDWSELDAELVALYSYDRGGVDVIEQGITQHFQFSGPSVSLGANTKCPEETLDWLRHRIRSSICFPHVSMGPDLIFVLRLSDGSLLWVALQAKFSLGKNGTLSRSFLRQAMRSVTPAFYFIDKDGNPFSPASYPTLTNDTSDFLSQLPHRRPDAGRFSLLRVIASFPAEPGLKRCILEDPDTDGHPLACLNMGFVKKVTAKLTPVEFLESLKGRLETQAQRQSLKKRKRGVQTAGSVAGPSRHGRTKKLKLN